MKKLKVLLITGLHGIEERSQIIADDFIKQNLGNKKFDITSSHINFDSKERDIKFNLNRLDNIEKMENVLESIKEIKKQILENDIILDLHNSPICSNLLLVSSGNIPDWKVSKKKYRDMVVWRTSEFETMSEFGRKNGKISFTVEFGGMLSQDGITPKKDLKFLTKTLNLCEELHKYENHYKRTLVSEDNGYIDLFVEKNKLRSIVLKQSMLLHVGKRIDVDDVKNDPSWATEIKKENVSDYNYKFIASTYNYCNACEAVLIKIKKGKNNGKSTQKN